MDIPSGLRYTKDHEWLETDPATGRVKMGITDYAQDALGDIVFVQLPEVGTKVQVGVTFSEVESTKSVSDIYGPVTGVVVEVNTTLADNPQSINEKPYGDGWICVIEPVADATEDHLLDAKAYGELVGE
jgi:glycine cleavage system H protein